MVSERVLASRCEAPGEAVSGFMAAGVALLLELPEKYCTRVVAAGGTCVSAEACQRHSGWGLSSAYCVARVRQVAAEAKVPVSGGAPTSCAREKTEASCGI